MDKECRASERLAAAITKSASKQTYYTIRLLADREREGDAYRAYGYFRWLDDVLDAETPSRAEAGSQAEKIAFAQRQAALLEACYRRETPQIQYPEEGMLVDMIRHDAEKNSGLQAYLRNMMDVMIFDAGRRGQVISQAELSEYSHKLAKAVTEAIYYFIGHEAGSPCHEARYLAVNAAHITHMLRDTVEDVENGYFNIPREALSMRGLAPQDVSSEAYREWVCGRIQLARGYFKAGRECTNQVRNWRCRLAGYAYTARFEWLLDVIERENYCLRAEYPERKGLRAGVWMAWSTLASMFASTLAKTKTVSRPMVVQPVRIEKR